MRYRDFGMCFYWSNLQAPGRAMMPIAPDYSSIPVLSDRSRPILPGNGTVLRLRGPECYHIFILLFEREGKWEGMRDF
jgi:hypothetical protein